MRCVKLLKDNNKSSKVIAFIPNYGRSQEIKEMYVSKFYSIGNRPLVLSTIFYDFVITFSCLFFYSRLIHQIMSLGDEQY